MVNFAALNRCSCIRLCIRSDRIGKQTIALIARRVGRILRLALFFSNLFYSSYRIFQYCMVLDLDFVCGCRYVGLHTALYRPPRRFFSSMHRHLLFRHSGILSHRYIPLRCEGTLEYTPLSTLLSTVHREGNVAPVRRYAGMFTALYTARLLEPHAAAVITVRASYHIVVSRPYSSVASILLCVQYRIVLYLISYLEPHAAAITVRALYPIPV